MIGGSAQQSSQVTVMQACAQSRQEVCVWGHEEGGGGGQVAKHDCRELLMVVELLMVGSGYQQGGRAEWQHRKFTEGISERHSLNSECRSLKGSGVLGHPPELA